MTPTVTREEHRGKAVVYVDPTGKPRDAVITEVHGANCINVAFVSDDPKQWDSYGLKIERAASVMHGNIQQAHGNYWLLPGEERELPATK